MYKNLLFRCMVCQNGFPNGCLLKQLRMDENKQSNYCITDVEIFHWHRPGNSVIFKGRLRYAAKGEFRMPESLVRLSRLFKDMKIKYKLMVVLLLLIAFICIVVVASLQFIFQSYDEMLYAQSARTIYNSIGDIVRLRQE